MKRLIITADEFGQTRDVNIAIDELFNMGCITNAALMPNMDFTDEAIELANKHNINVGVHFNLTEGKPLSNSAEVKSLIDKNGHFFPPLIFLTRYFLGLIKIGEVEKELRAQIKKLRDAKIKLTHFDGHCYIQMLPSVMVTMIKVCKEFGINKTRLAYEKWHYRPNGIAVLITYNFWFRKFLPSLFLNKMRKILWRNSIRHTDNFYGALIIDACDVQGKLISVLNNVKEGSSELMVHPGMDNAKRKAEYDTLKSELFRNGIKANGIELISYSEL